jgi:hypothetical protein
VTVDPGSNPDHEILGGRLSKVERLLGEGEYPQDMHIAPCRFMTVRKGNCSNGQGGRKTIWSWGRGRDPKSIENAEGEKRGGIGVKTRRG